MILIAFGSNLAGRFESPRHAIQSALSLFPSSNIDIQAISRLWQTSPVPASDQPLFTNGVCQVDTILSPKSLLKVLKGIEVECGREVKERNAARIIDLDIIAYNDIVVNERSLEIPHPRMHERGFVLYPLCDVSPDWMHPYLHKSARELKDALPKSLEIELMPLDKKIIIR